jgi:hypothetical protein
MGSSTSKGKRLTSKHAGNKIFNVLIKNPTATNSHDVGKIIIPLKSCI